MSNLLARFAENAFWMARYMGRAENLARIIDVNETLARDHQIGQQWFPIVQLNADDERFFDKHEEGTPQAVLSFYVIDDTNPSSIRATVRMARENARSLRHLISTEMWMQLNVFYEYLAGLGARDIGLTRINRLCQNIKENCQTHTGITEGTFFRDETWHFYNIGKYLERADQASRLLDIKYRFLQPTAEDPDQLLDISQWNSLLRSVAGYHAFRRIHPRGIRPADVASFLLIDPDFPRSIGLCVDQVAFLSRDLSENFDLKLDPDIKKTPDALRGALRDQSLDAVVGSGMYDLIDLIQLHIVALSDRMAKVYFGGA